MVCEKCGNDLEVVLNSAIVTDITCDGKWVVVQYDWYCPTCEEYAGTSENSFEQA